MELETHSTGVVEITAEQLRGYAAQHKEADYLLVDVREPEEYEQAHVPGAKLIPLFEIEERAQEIKDAPEQLKIFYYRSGGRSGRAAAYAAQVMGLKNVFNLNGGMLGYAGRSLPDLPDLRAFDNTATVTEVLKQAINLEKGAERLYEALLDYLRDDPVAPVIEIAKAVGKHGTAALLELSLEMELRAYDLYRNLAHRAAQEDLRKTFLDLAEQEKRHAKAVVRGLARSASN